MRWERERRMRMTRYILIYMIRICIDRYGDDGNDGNDGNDEDDDENRNTLITIIINDK
jgi:hypothetical protein